ncbi:MAG: FKBP-type peptidyl-prolyl cis-trans isomerase [Pseudomonadota bacterium]
MAKLKISGGLIAGALLLAACETLPSLPNAGSNSTAGPSPCPAYATGQGPLETPFPRDCAGMQGTSSGLKWIELSEGDQTRGTPGPDATVVVSYEGFLASNAQLIDSSYQRGEPGVFQVSDLLPGWGEAVQKMSPGDEWVIYLPWPIAYGAEAVEDVIPARSDIVYRVRLDGFLTPEQLAAEAAARNAPPPQEQQVPTRQTQPASIGPDMEAWAKVFPYDAAAPGWNRLDSGVSYLRLERGNSTMRNALRSDEVLIHYEGRLASDSTFFDSSWSRGEPTRFPVSGVIPGFSEVLTYMKPGDSLIVHIPSDKAYGPEGSGEIIGPNADLMFQIQMVDIFPAQ